jgi:hypothetical protein
VNWVVWQELDRRVRLRGGSSEVRKLAWRIETLEGRECRRTLVDRETGEILDDVSLGEDGRIESYSAPAVPCSDAPNGREAGRVKLVVATPAGSNDGVIEDGGDDRVLPRQRQISPPLSQLGSAADMAVQDTRAVE